MLMNPGRAPDGHGWGERAEAAERAWSTLKYGGPGPSAIELIKPKKWRGLRKSCVFRLEGAGPEGGSVIAKLTSESTARLERHVYDALLSEIGFPSPTCYGVAEDERSGRWWLFVEEIEGPNPSRDDPEHLRALGAWLGAVTEGAHRLAGSLDLPRRDASFVKTELEAAHERMVVAVAERRLPDDAVSLLERLGQTSERLLAMWKILDRSAAIWPRTLTHGDLTSKNIRLMAEGRRIVPYVFDWEEAGWSSPALDLAGLAGGAAGSRSASSDALLESYASRATVFWPDITKADLERCLDHGRLLRLIRSITWATASLNPGFERSKGRRQVEWLTLWLESAVDSLAAGEFPGVGKVADRAS